MHNLAFPEPVKREVKRRAAFRCCRCQKIGVEIHHIVPESEGGSDDIDNAAPLCAKCHADYGDNPRKRTEIREMRDWWYEQVKKSFSIGDPRFQILEEKLDTLILQQAENQLELEEIKTVLHNYYGVLIEQVDNSNVKTIVSSIINIEKPPFIKGSPCQMSGQPCPACADGVMYLDPLESGVMCNKCGIFIAAIPPDEYE